MAEAETATKTKKKSSEAADVPRSGSTALDTAKSDAAAKPAGAKKPAPHVVLRLLLGFSGLSLLVGFFLPWLNRAGATEGTMEAVSGFNLAISGDLVGTPAPLLWLVPALGAALSATAFMGFRWAGQVAVGVSVGLLAYALYVLLQMFVQHTALGLWVVTGGDLVVLLLGVVAWMTSRDRKAKEDAAAAAAVASEAAEKS